jgi:hypothetical protein
MLWCCNASRRTCRRRQRTPRGTWPPSPSTWTASPAADRSIKTTIWQRTPRWTWPPPAAYRSISTTARRGQRYKETEKKSEIKLIYSPWPFLSKITQNFDNYFFNFFKIFWWYEAENIFTFFTYVSKKLMDFTRRPQKLSTVPVPIYYIKIKF